jgi:hypothetical protein
VLIEKQLQIANFQLQIEAATGRRPPSDNLQFAIGNLQFAIASPSAKLFLSSPQLFSRNPATLVRDLYGGLCRRSLDDPTYHTRQHPLNNNGGESSGSVRSACLSR